MLAQDQKTDPDIELLLGSETDLTFQEVELSPGVTVLYDTSRGVPRPIVPNLWKRKLFELVHNLSYPSIRNTKWIMAQKFVWKGLTAQVGKGVRPQT